jgi:hypothetical protein
MSEQQQKRTVFLNPKEGDYGTYYSGKGKEDGASYFVNPKEDGSVTITINGEKHIPNANKNGEGFNLKIGAERCFLNMGESTYGPYAKLDFVTDSKTSASDQGTPKTTATKTYNQKKL